MTIHNQQLKYLCRLPYASIIEWISTDNYIISSEVLYLRWRIPERNKRTSNWFTKDMATRIKAVPAEPIMQLALSDVLSTITAIAGPVEIKPGLTRCECLYLVVNTVTLACYWLELALKTNIILTHTCATGK